MDSSDSALLWLVWATKAGSISALIFQFLEFFGQFLEEVEYLWNGRIRLISLLYALCRYFPLCAQIVNFTLSEIIHSTPTKRLCMTAFIMKAATAQLTTTVVETILVVRVHALYNCSRLSGFFLIGILVIGSCFELTGTTMTLMQLRPGPGGNICKPARTSMFTMSFFLIGCGLIESVLLLMTLVKIILSRKTGWLRTPIISLMLRDSISVFVILVIVTATVIGFEVVRSMDDKVSVWAAAYSWYVALLSVSGCRVILNMRKLGATHRNRHRNQSSSESASNEDPVSMSTLAQFSTIIDLSDDDHYVDVVRLRYHDS